MKPLGALKFHENAIDAIDVTSKLIAAGSSDGYVTIWNVYNKDWSLYHIDFCAFHSAFTVLISGEYGNTGCGVFLRGVQN